MCAMWSLEECSIPEAIRRARLVGLSFFPLATRDKNPSCSNLAHKRWIVCLGSPIFWLISVADIGRSDCPKTSKISSVLIFVGIRSAGSIELTLFLSQIIPIDATLLPNLHCYDYLS